MTTEHLVVGQRDARDLRLDEKVWWLHETVRDKPQYGPHRYQVLFVRRGEFEYRFEQDMGPELLFPTAGLFNFFCGNEYSVGEAIEIANRLREGKPPEDDHPPTDLIGEYQKELDEKRALRVARTTVAPGLFLQRS